MMKTLIAAFRLEAKRLANKKNTGLFLLVFVLSLYFVQMGINNYKSIIENKEAFLNFERLKVNQYINYSQYGTYGFRILFIPSPLCTFFVNSSTISGLTSNVDSGERLNIYNSFKGRTLFAEKSGGFKDFSGIMLLLGSLFVLYLGYESLVHKDYLRFMQGFTGYRRLFVSVIVIRLLIIIFLFAVTVGCSWILLKINRLELTPNDYVHLFIYLGVLVLMLFFFFMTGTIAGSFKSSFAGFVTLIFSWFVLVFFIPGVVSTVTSAKAGNIDPDYHLEIEKLKVLMDFEKRAFERVGFTTGDNIESVRALMESYWKNEFREIQAFEKKLQAEIEENIDFFQTLSAFFPSTFYLSAGDEISSKGYENFTGYFSYIQELKEKFVRFYLNKRYYSNYSQVDSFIEDNENLFYARSGIPDVFWWGLLVNLFYAAGLATISYARFKRALRR